MNDDGYAIRTIRVGVKTFVVRLHRQVMGAPTGVFVDHRNGDRLDNRRENLRFATQSQNQANKVKQPGTSSRFKGVSRERGAAKWRAMIQHHRKAIRLGRFDSEVDAAKAYDAAAVKLYGDFARTNFEQAA